MTRPRSSASVSASVRSCHPIDPIPRNPFSILHFTFSIFHLPPMFPETPQTLLKKLAELAEGDDQAEWTAFVELYTTPVRNFIRSVNRGLSPSDVEDAVQEVFIRLVDVLRKEKIDRKKGKFRDYLAVLTRRLLIDRYRAALSRPDLQSEMGTDPDTHTLHSSFSILHSPPDPGALLDLRWRMAVHAAAVEHVLTKTAISEQSKRVYSALERGQSLREVAEAFGLSYAAVKQIKSRLDRAIAAVEKLTCH